jgi:hypothetical protein
MERCLRTADLEVHYIRRDRGQGLDNATVLCRHCYELMDSSPPAGPEPPPFSDEIKRQALERAGDRCECESSGGCH